MKTILSKNIMKGVGELKKKNGFIVLLILVALLSMSGCGTSQPKRTNHTPLPAFSAEVGKLINIEKKETTYPANIDLFFDMSVSMRGYLYPGATKYKSVMDGLLVTAETQVNKAADGQVHYYQFGDSFDEMQNPDTVKNWEAYNYSDSFIYLAIENANLEHLTVIVTDLAVETESLDTLINRIGTEYMSKGYAIGLVGVKSEYEGYVYSLEEVSDRVVLLTEGKEPKDQFPFYLLVLGQQEEITTFYKDLEYYTLSEFPKESYNYTLIPLASKGLLSQIDDSQVSFSRLNEDSAIFVDTQDVILDEKVPQYKINRSPKNEVGFNLKGLSYSEIPFIPSSTSTISNKIELLQYEEITQKWIPLSEIDKYIQIEDLTDGENMDINYEILPDLLDSNKSYAVVTTAYLKQGEEDEKNIFKVPEWIYNWTTDKAKISAWKDEFNSFKAVYGQPSSEKVATKYKKWLGDNGLVTQVGLSSTNNLDKFFKKISYFVEKGEDIPLYQHKFYITKEY